MLKIRPRNPLTWIKYRFLEWKWDRILRKSRCITWEQYFRVNDVDYNPRGHTVKDQLQGYPYVAVVPFKHLENVFEPLFGEIYNGNNVDQWCRQNCRGKYRWHWEHIIQDHEGQYFPIGTSGTDQLFFGFKLERDFLMFALRWS